MRKLASIQRIKSIEPIANADSIVKATVLGWQLVIKKDEFKPGDLCVYVEIDSILPDKPEFEFLRNRNFRIRTIKLRGQISQGICFPLNILPNNIQVEEGVDVTDVLNIVKYEPPVPVNMQGIMKGGFPSFIPKTDETRVQVLQDLLDTHKGAACYITEKLDGTSVTYFIKDGVFGVCSRNLELEENEDNLYWKTARQFNIEEKLRRIGCNIAIQGELVGEGIQGNKLKLKGQHVFVFSVFLIDEYRYAMFHEWMKMMEELDLPTVPVINDNYRLENNIDDILSMSEIFSPMNGSVMSEGIVIRLKESKDLVSFKAISNEFLLKYGE
ncbi:RNA ligase (ATP) [Niastella sp. OAS944]|uniref:RNA ligase (ATP) n=1 Tax=Niastella sp. OAS944 TaxID=2664089 RepID=UPI00348407F8|nr:RNA ligase (TIGR02306 family) [Chitinophagaceae bacterium OAS944]